jgi:hypothetical protein
MNPEEILETFFKPGTKGYKILFFYFSRYQDLFEKTTHQEFNEFLNQIYLNTSAINFSEDIKNIEAYIIGTLKIQCRVQLDLALKLKNRQQRENKEEGDNEEHPISNKLPAKDPDPHDQVESTEVFSIVNTFKLSLKDWERDILNSLIDEIPRKEIAEMKNQNLNTIDTQIRRIRIKLSSYLKENGYKFNISDKYDFN